MQILVQAHCTRGESLREAIANDTKLAHHGLKVSKQQQPGRAPGWLKVHATNSTRGALNITWDAQLAVLNARVITRNSKRPSPIVGDFINYLLDRHKGRVQWVATAYR